MQHHVRLERRELEEVLPARRAGVRGLAHVGLEVALEARELRKGLSTHLALEGLWPQVQLHVVPEVGLPRERF